VPRRLLFHACLVAMPLGTGTLHAQDVDADSLRLYGGTYSTHCGDAKAPELIVGPGTLTIRNGSRQLHTPLRMDSHTSFGAADTSAIPDGYELEFIGDDFSLYVFTDAKGPYMPLEGYTPAAKPIVGDTAMRARFGRCKR
jgi:hypothetical protein